MTFQTPRSWPLDTPLDSANLNTWVRDQQVALKALVDTATANRFLQAVTLPSTVRVGSTAIEVDEDLRVRITTAENATARLFLCLPITKGTASASLYLRYYIDDVDYFNRRFLLKSGSDAGDLDLYHFDYVFGLSEGEHVIRFSLTASSDNIYSIRNNAPVVFAVEEYKTGVTVDGVSIVPSAPVLPAGRYPVGGLISYAGDEPAGFLRCDGRAVSRERYSALFVVIGTEFGSGDGSTTFNLPNLAGQAQGLNYGIRW